MSQLRHRPSGPRRARQPGQKAARRAAILDAARTLAAEAGPEALRMGDLAERLGLAKGTPFLYFATKEALLLALLEEALGDWFEATGAALRRLSGRGTPRGVARLLTRALAARPLLRRLLALLHGTLEENLDLGTLVAFKRVLLAGLGATGAALEAALPALPRGRGAEALLRLHALTIGVESMTRPSPAVRLALAEPDLAPFDLEFEPVLEAALADLLAGACDRPAPHER